MPEPKLDSPSDSRRRDLLKETFWNKGTAVLLTVYAVAGFVTWFRDEFLTPNDVERYRVIRFIPRLPWYIWVILALASLLLLGFEGMFREIRKREKSIADRLSELNIYRREQARAKVEVIELKIAPVVDCETPHRYHVFILATFKLNSPFQLQISEYKLNLARSGILIPTERYDDLPEWRFFNTKGMLNEDVEALPFFLRSGYPATGWLHFITKEGYDAKDLVDSSAVLIADSENGAVNGETENNIGSYIRKDIHISRRGKNGVLKSANEVGRLMETPAMWLGSDEVWRFKTPYITKQVSDQAYQYLIQSPNATVEGYETQTSPDSRGTQSLPPSQMKSERGQG